MRFSTASASLIGLSTLVTAAPFSFANNPLGNSFPNPSADQLIAIEKQAHGSLPNGGPPATITEDTKTSLRLIAFNELMEVAFFTELLSNITNNVDGYHIHNRETERYIIKALTAIQAQEELHLLNANGALGHFNAGPIQPCQYNFPVTNLADAIGLASTFTDVVLGTLQDVQTLFGIGMSILPFPPPTPQSLTSLSLSDGDNGLIRGVASVIGQEGEQNGFFRNILSKLPSALPFLTTSTREFAFSALNQNFVIPNSCPNSNTIALPIFSPLTVLTSPKDLSSSTTSVNFQFTLPSSGAKSTWKSDWSGLSLVYINQQNKPVVETLTNAVVSGETVTFTAAFPFDGFTFGNGLTIAVVADATADLTSADAVAKATVFGPGLIEVN